MTSIRHVSSPLRAILIVGIALSLLAADAGCQRAKPTGPFAADARARGGTRVATEPLSRVDQPGVVDASRTEMSDYVVGPSVEMRRDEKPTVRPLAVGGRAAAREPAAVGGVVDPSATIAEQIRPPSETADRRNQQDSSTTAPATQALRVGATRGEFLTIGGVVAEVNGQPIYANKVLSALEPKLAAMARNMDARQFRAEAASEISQKIVDFIENELEFAAASRELDAQEKEYARLLTEKWRQDQVNLAGGSEELARRRFRERGENFDERVKEMYRVNMSRLFYQKRVWPRVQVSAAEMRREYDRQRTTKFTVHDRAKFRLIKIDPSQVGDASVAADRAAELRKRAETEDFARLAEYSTDSVLARNGGLLPSPAGDGFYTRGSFAVEEVEEAVWKLQPGEVTDVIDTGNAFYIAKLEEKESGKTLPFEAESTQDEIRRSLQATQFAEMRQRQQEMLMADAVVRGDPRLEPASMQTALDIAMQRYPAWRGTETAATKATTTPTAAE